MENTKIEKPLTDYALYAELAQWCNASGYVIKDDNLQYYYCQKPAAPELTVQQKIEALEAQVTPRRLREAQLGIEESIAFIKNVDGAIKMLRSKLSGVKQ